MQEFIIRVFNQLRVEYQEGKYLSTRPDKLKLKPVHGSEPMEFDSNFVQEVSSAYIVNVCIFYSSHCVHLNLEVNDFKLPPHARQGVDWNVRASRSTPCHLRKWAQTLSSQLLNWDVR
jgi:hypothetical protein